MKQVKISEITVENRVRKAYGFLDSLERSIKQLGLLQPIGITPDKKLIFGARRLKACTNLGMETIPCVVVDLDDPIAVLRMERDENDQRVDFTPSEKVEIGRRIEEKLSGRNHRPSKESVQNFAQFKGEKSQEIAAKSVGMNKESYRQAKAVVDNGDDELIHQMDTGEKSIHSAYKSVKKEQQVQTFKITLYKNPKDDAEVIVSKAGKEYSTQLAIAILKKSGHKIESL